MANWSSGYVTDVDYIYGYYDDFNPVNLPFTLLTAGLLPPRIETACELGFGQGISITIHAATSGVEWWGTDFMPSHAATAQTLNKAAGSTARLFDESFEEFCNRPDLPNFDLIALHGIASWVADRDRALIVEFLRRRLNVGGIAYISYNTLPGWSAFYTMRQIIAEHSETFGTIAQGIQSRLDSALSYAERLLATEPIYAKANPAVATRLQSLMRSDRGYLPHELLNRNWLPMHFTDVKRWLEPSKLTYGASADHLDGLARGLLGPAQQQLLAEASEPAFRELLMDVLVNRSFRRDYWIKGPLRARPMEIAERLRQQHVMLARPRASCNFKVEGLPWEVSLDPAVYLPLVDRLADYKPVTIGALADEFARHLSFEGLCEALRVLWATGSIRGAPTPEPSKAVREIAHRLNAHLISRARTDASIQHLASPVLGGGVAVSRTSQLMMLAQLRGERHTEWPDSIWRLLASQGECLTRDGKTLSPAESLQMLQADATDFASNLMPAFQAMGVIPDSR